MPFISNGLAAVSSLEQMPAAVVFSVVIARVANLELLHQKRYVFFRIANEKVNVIVHQTVCENRHFDIFAVPRQAPEEIPTILVVFK